MLTKNSKDNLHRKMSLMLLAIAGFSSIVYFVFVVAIVDRLDETMIATLVGHEIDELVTELVKDPGFSMPHTASVKAYLASREKQTPIPAYLKHLAPSIYDEIYVDDKIYNAVVIELENDRLYMTFDVTALAQYRWLLIALLIGGGVLSALILFVTGFWLSKKYLQPVSTLAEELSLINPNQRNVHIEEKYKDYEVGMIARAVDAFLRRMDSFVIREQSFTAAISHELRTPVAVIMTSIDLLEHKGIAESQRGVINRIKASTDYMSKVIDSLLFFARHIHDTADHSLPLINLSVVCDSIVKQYESVASDKNLTLTLKKDHKVHARILGNHIEIILGNLVRNAINHTDQGGVEIALYEDGFSVSDSGQGMDENHVDDILQRCNQRSEGGSSGLGLYLITNICRYYGLELDIQSSIGKGSRFRVRLPSIA